MVIQKSNDMKFRRFGSLDWQPSALGFGTMRLPVLDGDTGRIDQDLATRMVRHAIDCGVNYVDTAYPYHRGQSESFLGQCLQGGYRAKVHLADKMPSWLIRETADFERYLSQQLQRLQTDWIDFYLLHSLSAETWRKIHGLGVLEWAEKAMASGRFQYLGFSFHDQFDVFQEILEAYDRWTFCQIQYNFMDRDFQAGERGLFLATTKGLAVVSMEPIRGGLLAVPPPPIQELWQKATRPWKPAEWALQWVWNQPEIALALSGMSTMEQVEENLVSAGRSGVGQLTTEELASIEQIRLRYLDLCPIPCSSCDYCQPCPQGVVIPEIFRLYNDGIMYNKPERSRFAYTTFIPPEKRVASCIACRQCEQRCPQNLPIVEWLEIVQAFLCPSV
jgi:predicted aldo/keto reductase-like oxidoreductase